MLPCTANYNFIVFKHFYTYIGITITSAPEERPEIIDEIAPKTPKLARSIIIPARRTPKVTARTVDLKLIFKNILTKNFSYNKIKL